MGPPIPPDTSVPVDASTATQATVRWSAQRSTTGLLSPGRQTWIPQAYGMKGGWPIRPGRTPGCLGMPYEPGLLGSGGDKPGFLRFIGGESPPLNWPSLDSSGLRDDMKRGPPAH